MSAQTILRAASGESNDRSVFLRPKDLEPVTDDLALVLGALMRIDARLENIELLLQEDDDGEDEEADS